MNDDDSVDFSVDELEYGVYDRLIDIENDDRAVLIWAWTTIHDFYLTSVEVEEVARGTGEEGSMGGDAVGVQGFGEDSWMFSECDSGTVPNLVKGIRSSTLRSFCERNLGPHALQKDLFLTPGVEMVTEPLGSDVSFVRKRFIEVSRVGLDTDYKQAFVYFAELAPAGEGWFFLLELVDGEWVIVAKVRAWIY